MESNKPPLSGNFPGTPQFLPARFSKVAILLSSILLFSLTAIIAVSSLKNPAEDPYERILRTGTIRIGYAAEAPFAYLDDRGQVTGESPEIATYIWKRAGVHSIEWVQLEFGTLISQLRAGRIDQIAAGMFIRPERSALIAFTPPTVCIEPAILVLQGNPYNLHSFQDIAANPKLKLAVLAGAVEADDAKKAGIPESALIQYPTPDLALASMHRGTVNALALSSLTIAKMAAAHPDMERALPFTIDKGQGGCAAFAFRLEDTQLRAKFSSELTKFIGTEAHRQLIAPFGFTREHLPPKTPATKD